tara:strand:+ start:30 stop:269 length:240 start_codon:yes stop_codon:yes gene_type:complete
MTLKAKVNSTKVNSKKKKKYYRPNVNDRDKIPYKFTPDAQEERNWKANKDSNPNNNFSTAKGNKVLFNANYDEIDWSKK